MTLKINYLNKKVKLSNENLAIFNIKGINLGKYENLLKTGSLKEILKKTEKDGSKKNIIKSFDLSPAHKIIIITIKENFISNDVENAGSLFYDHIKTNKINNLSIIVPNNSKIDVNEFIHGAKLKSYEFNIYKSLKKEETYNIKIISNKKISNLKTKLKKLNSLEKGVFFTRDLVSEPGNILHPDEYAKRLMKLKKYGLKVTVYNEKKLKKLGLNALLGVGQGSIRGSYLVTIEWKGSKSKSKPLSFIGKGVCFDTGGISLKPARFMEDMTYDMAGSAVVAGLMKTFALRKAKINAVGVVGLVENMPGGNAQRPGDIVKSYSGKTIEVLNTDAEGRLVLADALTFTEKKFKPKIMIDLATLTGAIIVCLGSEYAGLFSNDDKLSKQLYSAGEKVEEKVWRLPLHKNYDKLMDSKIADVQNINYVGGAGSTTAAQFLQRFVINKTSWAHLDIAGMAFSKYAGALNPGGATGFGVRLLNKFVEENYE